MQDKIIDLNDVRFNFPAYIHHFCEGSCFDFLQDSWVNWLNSTSENERENFYILLNARENFFHMCNNHSDLEKIKQKWEEEKNYEERKKHLDLLYQEHLSMIKTP